MIKQGKIIWVVFLLSSINISMAQDIILKNDNSTILSKVIEVSSIEIKYKKWSNQEGPTYSISTSEVLSITYQNGDVERFSSKPSNQNGNKQQLQSQFKGYMDDGGSWGQLRINGRVLTDNEVRILVSPQNYELYLKAKRQNITGIVFDAIGAISLGVAGLLLKLDKNYEYLPAAGAFAIICVVSLPTGIILGVSGGNKMKRIAQEYNKSQGKSYSLNVSPSLMKLDTPQSTNNYGLGLTLSMNF